MKSKLLLLIPVFILFGIMPAQSEWSGSLQQGWQSRKQFFDPQEVNSPFDTMSSATRTSNEQGMVTVFETGWDWDLPAGTLKAGLYSRLFWYAMTWENTVLLPVLSFRNNRHEIHLGSQITSAWGSGLLKGAFPVGGVRYTAGTGSFQNQLYYAFQFERSDFQTERIAVAGISTVYHLKRGRTGLLYQYDASSAFEDASRNTVMKGGNLSWFGNWEWSNNWYAQAEVVAGDKVSMLAGIDLPLIGFLSLQGRVRYMDQGYTPLLSALSRDGNKQTYFTGRLPMAFYAEQLIVRPEWGLKHAPDQDYWVPGIKIDATIMDSIWIEGYIAAEQPVDRWGAVDHYEYTRLKLIWMPVDNWSLNLNFEKTFNGFFKWKDIIMQAEVNYTW